MAEVPVPVDARDSPSGDGGWKSDPTANVRALVALEVKRMDDLRAAESRRVDEQAALRAQYDEKLRDAEAKRIDAIRAVDVNAVSVANDRAAVQATVLAAQVAASAEALRGLVATTAATQSATVAAQFNQVTERLSTLERASYEGAGKSQFTDPAQAALLAEVRTLSAARSVSTGTGAGSAATIAYLFGAIGAVACVLGIVVVLTR